MPRVVGQDQSVYQRYTCGKCGAINEVTPNEISVLHQGKDYDGGTYVQYGFHCGGCGKEVVTREW